MLQLFYMYIIYCIVLYVRGMPLYRSHYRCSRDMFDYYERVRIFSREKHIWKTLPDSVNTCEVPYYKAYCISKPFNYSYRLPMKSNHYESITRRNRLGITAGSYTSNRTHPFVKFDILCIPKGNTVIINKTKQNRRSIRYVSKKLYRREL